jgi:hypothetical protein
VEYAFEKEFYEEIREIDNENVLYQINNSLNLNIDILK